MKVLAWVTLIALVLLGFFAIANWSLLVEPAPLNFLLFTVQGSLGLILLVATLAFVALFAVYAVSIRTTALVETRRHLKELEAQRDLADKAEASRFTALSNQLEQESTRLRAAIEATRAEVLNRADALEDAVAKSLNEATNSLAAHVGQVDDKLNRMSTDSGSRLPPPKLEA
jgi:hypothetical protein